MRYLAALLVALTVSGCSATQTSAPLVRRQVAAPAARAYDCAPQARAVAPQYALDVAEPTHVIYTQGPAQSARAALQVPGSIIECGGTALGEGAGVLGRFLKCVGGHLTDPLDPAPSVRYGYAYGPSATAQDCCGGNCGLPAPRLPAPPPLPVPPGGDDAPESIPAVKGR